MTLPPLPTSPGLAGSSWCPVPPPPIFPTLGFSSRALRPRPPSLWAEVAPCFCPSPGTHGLGSSMEFIDLLSVPKSHLQVGISLAGGHPAPPPPGGNPEKPQGLFEDQIVFAAGAQDAMEFKLHFLMGMSGRSNLRWLALPATLTPSSALA